MLIKHRLLHPPELLDLFNDYWQNVKIADKPGRLYAAVQYMMNMGGKRLRPVLLLLTNNMFDHTMEHAMRAASGIELFHNFTLIHDDIMDRAPLRRGRATVHEKYGSSTAILAGDVMMVVASSFMGELCRIVTGDIFEVFNNAALEVCEGQQLDMEFESENNVSPAAYIEMIGKKTAALMASSVQIGALLGGATQRDVDLLGMFGRKTGISFQLMDDILDTYGEPGKFGKKMGGDILCNKKTYLLTMALQMAEGSRKEQLHFCLENDVPPDEKIATVKSIYDALELRKIAEEEMMRYFGQAQQHLSEVDLPADRKEIMKQFTTGLLSRSQ